jgi:nitroreductase
VHLVSDLDLRHRALGFQNGNRGFGDSASKLLVLTVDLSYFAGAAERNQGFVDGGMFAMSVVYALHSLGLGTCCLNWCAGSSTDRALRRELGIADCEVVLLMLVVGGLPDEFCVTRSARRDVSEVLVTHR